MKAITYPRHQRGRCRTKARSKRPMRRVEPEWRNGAYFGYSETFGGYPGGQAEYLRVPFANFTPFVVLDDCELEDEKRICMRMKFSIKRWLH